MNFCTFLSSLHCRQRPHPSLYYPSHSHFRRCTAPRRKRFPRSPFPRATLAPQCPSFWTRPSRSRRRRWPRHAAVLRPPCRLTRVSSAAQTQDSFSTFTTTARRRLGRIRCGLFRRIHPHSLPLLQRAPTVLPMPQLSPRPRLLLLLRARSRPRWLHWSPGGAKRKTPTAHHTTCLCRHQRVSQSLQYQRPRRRIRVTLQTPLPQTAATTRAGRRLRQPHPRHRCRRLTQGHWVPGYTGTRAAQLRRLCCPLSRCRCRCTWSRGSTRAGTPT